MARKVMIIRHAEKPDGQTAGISMAGEQDPEELTVRGWQRSGALVKFFAAPGDNQLAIPKFIFVAGNGPHSKSLRPQHTVATLADQLVLDLNTTHLKGDEEALAREIVPLGDPVLVAWQHEAIPEIVNLIVGNKTSCPQEWPDTRFDLVWVLDQQTPAAGWTFTQVPQLLMPGDSDALISGD